MGKVLMDDLISVRDTKFKNGAQQLVLSAQVTLDSINNSIHTPPLLKIVLEKWLTWQEKDEIDIASSISSLNITSQWYAALLAWGAWVIKKDGSEVHMTEFLDKRGRKSEIESICIPLEIPNRVYAESAVCRTPRDYPIVFAAAVVDYDGDVVKDINLAMTGAAKKSVVKINAVDTLKGKKLTDQDIESVKQQVLKEVEPKADFRGSVEYRKEMAALLSKRVLKMCVKGDN